MRVFALLPLLCWSSVALTSGAQMAAVPQQPGLDPELFLELEQPVEGTLNSASACHLLQTEPDSSWMVTVTGSFHSVEIGTGTTCETVRKMLTVNPMTINSEMRLAQALFVAGGGTYTIKVRGFVGQANAYQVGAGLSVKRGRKLGPGLAIARVNNPAWADGVSASTAPLSGREAPVPGSQIQDCAECPAMVVIKPGSFMMGSTAGEIGHEADEGPRHMVTFGQGFAIGKTEVTFDEWDACVKEKGCIHLPADQGWGKGRRPAVDVSWKDAMQYVRWLRMKTGQNYYLPSEAEWEYAARAGTQTAWNTGKAIITDDANILNAFGRTVPVGGYPANAFGLHDVHGNAAEWIADCYEVGYFGVPVNGGAMSSKGCKQRLIRGGPFHEGVTAQRSANRRAAPMNDRHGALGFRVARGL